MNATYLPVLPTCPVYDKHQHERSVKTCQSHPLQSLQVVPKLSRQPPIGTTQINSLPLLCVKLENLFPTYHGTYFLSVS